MTTTKEIVILVGPPGSGKTTLANHLMNNAWTSGIKTSRISQDDQGKQGHMDLFESALKNEIDFIIVDRMGFDRNQRNRYLNPAKKAGYKTRIIVLHVPYQTCLERAATREDHPTINGAKAVCQYYTGTTGQIDPEEFKKVRLEGQLNVAKDALGTFFKNYERVQDSEADVVERIGWEQAKGRALVVDIDGTIADIEHRRGHVQRTDGKKKDWKAFFDDMAFDVPHKWCVDIVKAIFAASGNMTPEQQPYSIVFASGRPDNYRKMSEEWLDRALGHRIYQHLFMRRRDDSRQDNIVKEIILEFELKPRFKDMVMIDDRDQVVKMWRSHGYTVLQCDEGLF